MAWAMKYSSINLEAKKIIEVAEDAHFEMLTWDVDTSPWPIWILSL